MREIIFDTETTGLDPATGDRIVEIGCVECINHVPTGETFHVYINPERDMPEAAFKVHGLSTDFLKTKPVFAAIAEDFVNFIGDAKLVAHNAMFDLGFINAELKRLGYDTIDQSRIVDTLALARKKNPFGPNSLDALCARFGIDNSRRTKHGALLDAEILAEVYLEMMGGRQTGLDLAAEKIIVTSEATIEIVQTRARPAPLPSRLTGDELAAHKAFVATLGDEAVWKTYVADEAAQ